LDGEERGQTPRTGLGGTKIGHFMKEGVKKSIKGIREIKRQEATRDSKENISGEAEQVEENEGSRIIGGKSNSNTSKERKT